jgi:uncharacterized protein
MLISYLKKCFYTLVFIGFSAVHAGSYEDFFKAVKQDDSAAVLVLLNRGFDANTVNPAGTPALLQALQDRAVKVAGVLANWPQTQVEVRTAKDESPLMLAALHGMTALCEQLIGRGADVNKPGWAPLHYAATNGHLAVIKLLLEHHAYIDAASPNGTTPLMMAAYYGTLDALKVLLDGGADPLLKNDQNLTALDFGQRAQRQDAVELIASVVRARQPKGSW